MTMRPYLDVILDPVPAYARMLVSSLGHPMTLSSDGAATVLVEGNCDAQAPDVADLPLPRGIAPAVVADLPRALSLSALVAALQQSLGPCETCKGTRRVMEDATKACEACEGMGEVECGECGHERDCWACDDGFVPIGDGTKVEVPCQCTDGLGRDGWLPIVTLDGVDFNAALAAGDLQRLPDQGQRVRTGGAAGAFVVRGVGWCYVLLHVLCGHKPTPLPLDLGAQVQP